MPAKATYSIVGLILLAIAASSSMFYVYEWEKAVLFRLGEVVRADYKPGLHFKVPFINNVKKFDGRILTLDSRPERFLTSEKKNVIVDSFVKWKINDVTRFYTSVKGDINKVNLRLDQFIKDGLRSEFSKRTIKEAVSGDREQIMAILTKETQTEASGLGIEVVDVRIKRIDLPTEVSSSVYRRMEAERLRVAKDFRSRGQEEAEQIRAEADREATIIKAEAYRDSEISRGEGDAKAADIYAKAFSQNAEFYSFYRRLNAYTSVFSDKSSLMVLDADTEFFKFMKQTK